ncbi:DUF4347 domain-containing protein, partial [Hydrogenophaga sp. 5NK40-0174]|uniref:DUF4347 domain-containing protein n=1 Tax=Hydrogenophaga sp. 5NK40-0174 TaxID=3127649 RepID=UPI00333E40DF
MFDAALPATMVEAQADDSGFDTQDLLVEDAAADEPVAPVVVAPAVAEEDQAATSEEASTSASADTAAGEPAADAVTVEAAEEADAMIGETDAEAAVAGDEATESGEELEATEQSDLEEGELAETESVTDSEEERVEIIFVDAVAEDIVDDLADHPGEIYVLDADRDGIEQMAEVLGGRTGVDAVHIISHGSAGQLDLGSGELTTATMQDAYADELEIISAALSEDADILLYGCDVGAGSAGQDFVNMLADATGADVVASSDDTGLDVLGGDWVLEVQNADGTIETETIEATAWAGLLTTQVNNGTGAFLAVYDYSIYSIDATTGVATILTTFPTSGQVFTWDNSASVTVPTSGFNGLNSLAVDQSNGLIYFTLEWRNDANRALYAYDYVADRIFVVDTNVTNNGISIVSGGNTGLASGAAVFNNGYLYMGVENNQGGNNAGTVSNDTIYRVTLSADGRTIAGNASILVGEITGNDWGDLGYDSETNSLVSSDGIAGGGVNIVRYVLSADGTSVTNTVSQDIFTTNNTQAAHSDAVGGVNANFLVGSTIQQFNPVTGALIGSAINITTNGTTPLGAVFDAAGWTPPTGSIGDSVYADANGNGVQDAGESGIANVTVELINDVNNNGVVDAGEATLATDTTNASGQYTFTGILPGHYIVRVTDTAGALGAQYQYTSAGGAVNANGDVTRIGQNHTNIDFGVVRPPVNNVPPAQTVAEDDSVTFSNANGNALQVVDNDGQTLTVTVWSEQGTVSLSGTAGLTLTRGDGTDDAAIIMTGSAADINAALNGLVYQPTSDNNGAGAVNLNTTDGTYLVVDRVAIDITPVDDTNPDSVTTAENTPVDITPMDNDSFEGPAWVVDASTPSNGSVAVATDGTTITYTPDTGFGGADSFTYTVATIDEGFNYEYWTVNPTTDSPIFDTVFPAGFPTTTPDGTGWTPGISEDDGLLIQDEQSDTDPENVVAWSGEFLVLEGDTYTFGLTADNVARLIVDGNVVVTTSAYSTEATATVTLGPGAHTFVVQYADLRAPQSVNLTYSGADTGDAAVNVNNLDLWGAAIRYETDTVDVYVNKVPVANPDTNSIFEDAASVTGDISINDTDGNGTGAENTVALDGSTPAVGSYGTISLNPDGTYSYALDNTNPVVQGLGVGESVVETYSYVLTDSDGDTAVSTLTITINGVNDAPLAEDNTYTVGEDDAPAVVGNALTDNDAVAG